MTGLRPALRPALPPSFPASSPQSRQEIRATDAGLMCSCAYKNLGFGRDFALSECSSRRSLSKDSKSKLAPRDFPIILPVFNVFPYRSFPWKIYSSAAVPAPAQIEDADDASQPPDRPEHE
jgi:hypothetical protein